MVLSRTLTRNQPYPKMDSHPLFIGRRKNSQNSSRSGLETVPGRCRTYWKYRLTDPTGFLFLVQHRSTELIQSLCMSVDPQTMVSDLIFPNIQWIMEKGDVIRDQNIRPQILHMPIPMNKMEDCPMWRGKAFFGEACI